MKKRLHRVRDLVILLVLCSSCNAQEFTIGVEEINYSPYYHIKNGQYVGVSRDLFDAFAAKYHHQFQYRPLPIKRLYRELLERKIDFKFPDHPYWGKDEKKGAAIIYSNPVVGFTDGVLVLPGNNPVLGELFKTVGFVRGFSPWPLMDAIHQGKLKTREVNSLKSLVTLTLDGKIDGAYFNVEVAKSFLGSEFKNQNSLKFVKSLPHDTNNYTMSTLGHTKFIEQLNTFLASEQAMSIRMRYNLGLNKLK